jgi:hypothetical protein
MASFFTFLDLAAGAKVAKALKYLFDHRLAQYIVLQHRLHSYIYQKRVPRQLRQRYKGVEPVIVPFAMPGFKGEWFKPRLMAHLKAALGPAEHDFVVNNPPQIYFKYADTSYSDYNTVGAAGKIPWAKMTTICKSKCCCQLWREAGQEAQYKKYFGEGLECVATMDIGSGNAPTCSLLPGVHFNIMGPREGSSGN